jgi:ATP-dependent 26S proteasome regulatory subunit
MTASSEAGLTTRVDAGAAAEDSRLADLDARLQLEGERFRKAGKDPGNVFRGLYIDESEANQLLGGLMKPDPPIMVAASALDRRLTRLQELFRISHQEAEILLATVAPDLDLRYERIFAYLQDDVSRKRPNVDFLLRLVSSSSEDRFAARRLFSPAATLVQRGLITIRDETPDASAPLLASALQADERVVAYLLGSNEVDHRLRPSVRALGAEQCDVDPAEPLPSVIRDISSRWLTAGETRVVVLEGPPGVGKAKFSRSIAGRLRSGLLWVDAASLLRSDMRSAQAMRILFREATLQESPIYWSNANILWEDGDRQAACRAAMLDEIAEWRGLVILAGPTGWPAPPVISGHPAIRIPISMPSASERLELWRAELPRAVQAIEGVTDAPAMLAARFRLTRGQIHDAVAIAIGSVSGNDHQVPFAALLAACRAVSSRGLTAVGDEVVQHATWDDIVLPQDSIDQLRELCASVRSRGTVLDDWGLAVSPTAGSGITALFAGPSGTGKTMAAGIVANELGLPIFRIDLARVVSKWIGETEKNLDRVFKAAEDSNAVLFLDEADALLGKRSEIKDSHDRYANLEISYLLQKMELYNGVAILATNMPQQLDHAFLRRLTFTVFFPLPNEAQRLAIWHTLWPPSLPRAADVDLQPLARFKLAGGNIRNILLAAAYLAAPDGDAVTMGHLRHALRREYQKLGKEIGEARRET